MGPKDDDKSELLEWAALSVIGACQANGFHTISRGTLLKVYDRIVEIQGLQYDEPSHGKRDESALTVLTEKLFLMEKLSRLYAEKAEGVRELLTTGLDNRLHSKLIEQIDLAIKEAMDDEELKE